MLFEDGNRIYLTLIPIEEKDKYLDESDWDRLLETYNNRSCDSCWESLYLMGELFKDVASFVADKLNFTYPNAEADKVTQYLHKVHLDSLKS